MKCRDGAPAEESDDDADFNQAFTAQHDRRDRQRRRRTSTTTRGRRAGRRFAAGAGRTHHARGGGVDADRPGPRRTARSPGKPACLPTAPARIARPALNGAGSVMVPATPEARCEWSIVRASLLPAHPISFGCAASWWYGPFSSLASGGLRGNSEGLNRAQPVARRLERTYH